MAEESEIEQLERLLRELCERMRDEAPALVDEIMSRLWDEEADSINQSNLQVEFQTGRLPSERRLTKSERVVDCLSLLYGFAFPPTRHDLDIMVETLNEATKDTHQIRAEQIILRSPVDGIDIPLDEVVAARDDDREFRSEIAALILRLGGDVGGGRIRLGERNG